MKGAEPREPHKSRRKGARSTPVRVGEDTVTNSQLCCIASLGNASSWRPLAAPVAHEALEEERTKQVCVEESVAKRFPAASAQQRKLPSNEHSRSSAC